MLPALSVTVQVTVVVPIGKVAGASLVTEATPQLSPVVGFERTTVAKQEPGSASTDTSAAQAIVGFSVSFTVTSCSQVAELPALSVTVQVTVVEPTGKVAGASLVTEATPQLSAVVGFERTTVAKHSPASLDTATSAAHVMVGSSLSATTTSC